MKTKTEAETTVTAGLADLRSKPFFEQVMLLSQIDRDRPRAMIPELFELVRHPLSDTAVANMVEDVLKGLLAGEESEVVSRLGTEDARERRFLFEVVKRYHFPAALDPLVKLLDEVKDTAMQYEVLMTLSEIPAASRLPLFRERINHPDPLIAALAIEMLGPGLDEAVLPKLVRIIEANEDLDRYHECALQTAKAIEALGRSPTPEVITFLAAKIHHRNPTARQLIHEALAGVGAEAVPALARAFDGDDLDMQIMAANILGEIGDRHGGDVMLAAMDRGTIQDANVRFAIYEAFGRIRFLKGLICLMDALDEPDDMCLLAVVGALDQELNSAVIDRLRGRLLPGDEAARRLARAVAAAHALHVFTALYPDPVAGPLLIDTIAAAGDPDLAAFFLGALEQLAEAKRPGDADRLKNVAVRSGGPRILAVDDSKSMILFYRSVAAAAGLEIVTAGNGQEALNLLERGERVDLVVSDMNMPEMNGIELVRKIRSRMEWQGLNVIMVTTESETSQVELARRVGVNAFLRKPFQPEALREKIAELTGRRG